MANVLVVAQNLDRSNAVKLLRKEIKKQICSTAEAGAPAGVPPAPVAASANAIVVPGLDVTVIMDEMQGMGFSREQCTAALNFAKGDKTEAVNFMLNNPVRLLSFSFLFIVTVRRIERGLPDTSLLYLFELYFMRRYRVL